MRYLRYLRYFYHSSSFMMEMRDEKPQIAIRSLFVASLSDSMSIYGHLFHFAVPYN